MSSFEVSDLRKNTGHIENSMTTDNQDTKEDNLPLANSTQIKETIVGNKDESEDIITVFDLANEIEKSLTHLGNTMQKSDEQFQRSIDVLEKKINQMEQ